MENQRDREFVLPKNIRQMGKLGETYKIYVEDFVYTYVHRTLREEQKNPDFVAAVLLGRHFSRAGQEYIFINGAQQVEFSLNYAIDSNMHFEKQMSDEIQNAALYFAEEVAQPDGVTDEESRAGEGVTDAGQVCEYEEQPFAAVSTPERQQLFWESVYQGIKEYFSEYELLGWYFELDGCNQEVSASMQQFFDATQEHGSSFLYLSDRINRTDTFFVQEQGRLQRLDGYAVYYEKNPAMQEYLVAQNRHSDPVRNKMECEVSSREDVARNYRAILNKLNEKPSRKKYQPFVYVAGIAVLAVVAATGISQIGNYQNLKTLEQTLQTFSGNVQKGGIANDSSELMAEEQGTASGTVENGQASGTEGMQEETEQASVAGTEAGNGSDEKGQGAQSTGDSATETGNATENAGENMSANLSQSAGADASVSDISQNTGGHNLTSENAADISGGTADSSARYYTVKKGDSLMSISKAVYHTTAMIPEICNANQIENMDMIYEGQQLLLP